MGIWTVKYLDIPEFQTRFLLGPCLNFSSLIQHRMNTAYPMNNLETLMPSGPVGPQGGPVGPQGGPPLNSPLRRLMTLGSPAFNNNRNVSMNIRANLLRTNGMTNNSPINYNSSTNNSNSANSRRNNFKNNNSRNNNLRNPNYKNKIGKKNRTRRRR